MTHRTLGPQPTRSKIRGIRTTDPHVIIIKHPLCRIIKTTGKIPLNPEAIHQETDIHREMDTHQEATTHKETTIRHETITLQNKETTHQQDTHDYIIPKTDHTNGHDTWQTTVQKIENATSPSKGLAKPKPQTNL